MCNYFQLSKSTQFFNTTDQTNKFTYNIVCHFKQFKNYKISENSVTSIVHET